MYGFLFRHFEERQFWWELVVLTRKLLFALIVNTRNAPEQQTMLGILCLLPYIALVNGQRPYSSKWLNYMDLLGASFATSLALSGLVMFGGYATALTVDEVNVIQGPRPYSPPPPTPPQTHRHPARMFSCCSLLCAHA